MKLPDISNFNFGGLFRFKFINNLVKNIEKVVFFFLVVMWLFILVNCVFKLFRENIKTRPILQPVRSDQEAGEIGFSGYDQLASDIEALKDKYSDVDEKIANDLFSKESYRKIDTRITAPEIVDTDKDGMPDQWEKKYGLNPRKASDAIEDMDKDTYTNLQEYQAGTDPTNPKSNPEGLEYLLQRYALRNISRETVSLLFMGYTQWSPEYLDLQINWRDVSLFPRVWRISQDKPDSFEGFHLTEDKFNEIKSRLDVGRPSLNASRINKFLIIPEIDYSIVQAIIDYRPKGIIKDVSDVADIIQVSKTELEVLTDKVTAEANVNSLSRDELVSFLEVSEGNAEEIIEYRKNSGFFTDLKEFLKIAKVPVSRLQEVKGVLTAKLDLNTAVKKDIVKFFSDERLADAILFYRETQGLFSDEYDIVSRGRIQGYCVVSCEIKVRKLPPKPGRPVGEEIDESEVVIQRKGDDPILLQKGKVTQGKEYFARVYDKNAKKEIMWNAGMNVGDKNLNFEIVEIRSDEVILNKKGEQYILKLKK
ncbi:MAG: helix-hairpin-helix domain-containing protein [Candidatus Aureabacteria bacterium]|nr:helix-hairpin-helix domain-containing protein [Candidatus Auribacterota bacterium]